MAHELRLYTHEQVTLASKVPVTYTMLAGDGVTLHPLDETHAELQAGGEVGLNSLLAQGDVTDEDGHPVHVSDVLWIAVASRHAASLGITWSESEPGAPLTITSAVEEPAPTGAHGAAEAPAPSEEEAPEDDPPHARTRRPR